MKKQCDLIMKGGITSGVVYPKVVTELAKEYEFVSIGGASAGAMAAGFTAAAEYCRKTQENMSGFDVLESMPNAIGDKLIDLFEPLPVHRKALKFLLKLRGKKKGGIILSSLWSIRLLNNTFKRLPNTYFGLCSGISNDPDQNLALTDWMNLWIERTAGRLEDNDALPAQPLTFGMLCKAGIRLRTITTNLSQRTPVTLPNLGHAYISKTDAHALLPTNMVSYIENYQSSAAVTSAIPRKGFYILPDGNDMPVLFAVRASLSFPVLLSAIPIYKYDNSLWRCDDEKKIPKKCWLSDGGITSNFPIHLFDAIFPARPTFGISLNEFDHCRQHPDDSKDKPFPSNRAYLPMKPGSGLAVQVNPIGAVFEFLMSIFNSAQTWQDTNQMYLSGYRERVVRISLKGDSEGGMNLEMTKSKIQALTDIGEQAGKVLNSEFDLDEHRWRRALSSYSAIENAFGDLAEQYLNGSPESMKSFLERVEKSRQDQKPVVGSYEPNNDELRVLIDRLDTLASIAKEWSENSIRDSWGSSGMPKPTSTLKVTPEKFVS